MIQELHPLRKIEDGRGALVVIEGGRTVPFEIKRVYYLTKLKSAEPRGFHAHYELRQFMVCMSGSCTVTLDDGKQKQDIVLNRPEQGLMIDKMVWHVMSNFSEDCILMVLASDHYNEKDYIRDYEVFRKALP